MQLKTLVDCVESRLKALGISANKASMLATGQPDAIRNLRRAVKDGTRRGVTTATLSALAPVLKTTPEWLLTGSDGQAAEALALKAADTALPQNEVVKGLAWVFQEIAAAPEAEARQLALAVARVIRMRQDQSGAPLSDELKRKLIALAIDVLRAEEP
jgi:hypothetical protein